MKEIDENDSGYENESLHEDEPIIYGAAEPNNVPEINNVPQNNNMLKPDGMQKKPEEQLLADRNNLAERSESSNIKAKDALNKLVNDQHHKITFNISMPAEPTGKAIVTPAYTEDELTDIENLVSNLFTLKQNIVQLNDIPDSLTSEHLRQKLTELNTQMATLAARNKLAGKSESEINRDLAAYHKLLFEVNDESGTFARKLSALNKNYNDMLDVLKSASSDKLSLGLLSYANSLANRKVADENLRQNADLALAAFDLYLTTRSSDKRKAKDNFEYTEGSTVIVEQNLLRSCFSNLKRTREKLRNIANSAATELANLENDKTAADSFCNQYRDNIHAYNQSMDFHLDEVLDTGHSGTQTYQDMYTSILSLKAATFQTNMPDDNLIELIGNTKKTVEDYLAHTREKTSWQMRPLSTGRKRKKRAEELLNILNEYTTYINANIDTFKDHQETLDGYEDKHSAAKQAYERASKDATNFFPSDVQDKFTNYQQNTLAPVAQSYSKFLSNDPCKYLNVSRLNPDFIRAETILKSSQSQTVLDLYKPTAYKKIEAKIDGKTLHLDADIKSSSRPPIKLEGVDEIQANLNKRKQQLQDQGSALGK